VSLLARDKVTPESAGWSYVGFEVLRPPAERDTGSAEHCVVVLSGTVSIGDWRELGGRADPWSGMPDAVYLPPGTRYTIEGDGEVAICCAPAR
jgi:5-deoxy-glucuronate isomerase